MWIVSISVQLTLLLQHQIVHFYINSWRGICASINWGSIGSDNCFHFMLELIEAEKKIDAILQIMFSNASSWMKMFELRLKFHWSLFPKVHLTIFQHWFRKWLGAEQATSHYLNQWWPSSMMHICFTRPQWVKSSTINDELCSYFICSIQHAMTSSAALHPTI